MCFITAVKNRVWIQFFKTVFVEFPQRNLQTEFYHSFYFKGALMAVFLFKNALE
jgi:hypothetical protein